MARYQLRRPSPVKVYPKRLRRQTAAVSEGELKEAEGEAKEAEGEEEEIEGEEEKAEGEKEEDEGPESPDSPGSSSSESSDGESDSDSDSDDEPPSPPAQEAAKPSQSGASSLPAPSGTTASVAASSAFTLAPSAPATGNVPIALESTTQSTPVSRGPTQVLGPDATSTPVSQAQSSKAAFTRSISSQGNLAAAPQVTETTSQVAGASSQATRTASQITTTSSTLSTTVVPIVSSSLATSVLPSSALPSEPPAAPAQSETAGERDSPQRSAPQEEKTLITKGAAAAAITLSILGRFLPCLLSNTTSNLLSGAIAIFAAVIICIKRRKRRQNQNRSRLADDAFDPGNTGSLRNPEIAHVADPPFIGSHLTRSTERSNTLFGAGPYERPETVSTDRNKSRFAPSAQPLPTPNPFADPPLNKAYDVLGGRPRSTTLTDRGSWIRNPFKDPSSERFDPFGELQEKARQERRRYLEESRKEAELAREFNEKEKMGLAPPDGMQRKGSDVTIGGVGVLDRSGGGGGYR